MKLGQILPPSALHITSHNTNSSLFQCDVLQPCVHHTSVPYSAYLCGVQQSGRVGKDEKGDGEGVVSVSVTSVVSFSERAHEEKEQHVPYTDVPHSTVVEASADLDGSNSETRCPRERGKKRC